jgi:hypothetical protein
VTDRRLRFIRGDSSEQEAMLATLDSGTIHLALPQPAAHATQILAIATTDLLARIFPRISFACNPEEPASPQLPPGPHLLLERLEEARQNGTTPVNPGEPTTTISLGDGNEADLYADGYGWQSYLGTEPSRMAVDTDDANPVGPLCAASRVAAHAFRHQLRSQLGGPQTPNAVYFSALDFRTALEPLDEPPSKLPSNIEGVLVGAGSVGGAAVYALARVPDLRGELTVVDPQHLEAANPDRAILATAALAAAQEEKVKVAVEALAHHGSLNVPPHAQTIAEFVGARHRLDRLPLVLCSVDSATSRRSLQDCLPLEVVNAACAPHEVMISGHCSGAGPCVCCMQMAQTLDSERIRWRLIAEATGFNRDLVLALLTGAAPLEHEHLEAIERRRGLTQGSLAAYTGHTLDELWEAELLYGESEIHDGETAAAVAAPWITSLAGFLLAAEALKHGDPSLSEYQLGPGTTRRGIKWEENVYGSPQNGLMSSPPRWSSNECLCRSPRRRRLTIARYGLTEDEYLA